MKRITTYGIVFACALLLWNVRDYGQFAWQKITGKSPCPWSSVLLKAGEPYKDAGLKLVPSLAEIKTEGKIGFYRTPERDFWTDVAGSGMLAYFLAERAWMEKAIPESAVRPGDTVIDVGAHIGIVTYFALKHGAQKVIAVEPDPQSLECLRRNFPAEIASGKVVLVPKAAWSKTTTLQFTLGDENASTDSAVLHQGTRTVDVPADTLDNIVASLGSPHIDYIKMDIQGAEKDALSGARGILATSHPRLMIEANHLPDDYPAIPNLVAVSAKYSVACAPCERVLYPNGLGTGVTPYFLYLR